MDAVQLLLVVIGCLLVTAYARKFGRQGPLLLTLVGLAVSFLPGLTRVEPPSELILAALVPPLLFSSALKFSMATLRRLLWPILILGVGLVAATAGLVAPLAALLVTGLGGGSAFVLAAVVAPPDAVTAVSIGRELGLPRKLMGVLTGESLLNDAMALTLFTLAVTSVTGEHTLSDNLALLFLYGASVGIAIGLVLGWLVHQVRSRLGDPVVESVLILLVPFAAYLAAEHIEASGVVAVVTAGFFLGTRSIDATPASRLRERTLFEAVDVLLEALAFGYVGLELRFVLTDLRDAGIGVGVFIGEALLVLGCVIVIRIALIWAAYPVQALWHRSRARALARHPGSRLTPIAAPDPAQTTVIAWSGMRGVVTVAAAAGVPEVLADGTPFPGRAEIQGVAFVVAVGTLMIQGSTLPWLIRRLGVGASEAELQADHDERTTAVAVAWRAGLQELRGRLADIRPGTGRERLETFLANAESVGRELDSRASAHGHAISRSMWAHDKAVAAARAAVMQAQRAALIAERDAGRLDDEIMREVLEELDLDQAAVEARLEGH